MRTDRSRSISGRILEAIAAAAAGAAIGYGFGLLVADLVGGDDAIPVTAAVIAGINGMFGGARGVYAWATPGGILAFALDSSWALISTALGIVVNVINTVWPDSGFGPEFSVRRNRHVFARGFALKRGFANTQGPVISNACLGRGDSLADHTELIELHEGLHVWQQRWFGPLHPVIYVVWGVAGAIVGLVYGLFSRKRRRHGTRIGKLIETAAYYDNPFEYWAYRNDDRWERNSAHPALKLGVFRWPGEDGD